MESYETMDELWLGAAQDVLKNGSDIPSRDGNCREITGYCARLTNPYAHFMFNPSRKLSPAYAAAELLWYLSGEQHIERIVPYAPQYERFVEDGVAYGAYGHRWKQGEQLLRLLALLRTNPDTRQAVMVMWDKEDIRCALNKEHKDLPCTLSMNFLVRDKKLNLIVTMRSNDLWLGTPYDVFCMTAIQILIAENLGLGVGWYQHQAGSLHVYSRNKEKFEIAASPVSFTTGPQSYSPNSAQFTFNMPDGDSRIKKALTIEEWNRKNKVVSTESWEALGAGSLLSEVVIMAGTKWDTAQRGWKSIQNKIMRKYFEEEWIPKKEKHNLYE